ncbi:MAG: DNA polymerase I [Gammaproteobacteria bacterium]|nr:DNA polymerase I [Gammaproteobacteria bacterium]
MSATKKPLILVDGSSYLYRAFHAMPSLTNSKKLPTGAIYGVINMLKKLLSDHQPEHIAVVFDAKGKTFRDDIYDQYKANRSAMPEDLVKQIEPIHAIIAAMGLPILMIDGVEADDVIGTLAKSAAKQGVNTLISTGDKDLAQLVDKHITLVNTMTDTYLNPESVKEKFGIPPESIIDYLALVGDTSDNIPGVPQCGPKTAVKWLLEYGTLEGVIKHADEIKGKVGEKLRTAIPQIPMSKQLATIKLDVPLSVSIEELDRKTPDTEQLIALFREYEFKNWLAALLAENKPEQEIKDKKTHYETILTSEKFIEWLNKLKDAKHFAFDTETTSLNYMQAEIVGVSFAITAGSAAYIPLAHSYENAPTQLSRDFVLRQLKPLLEDPNIKKIGQNIKYDLEVLANYGITLQGIGSDTMLESYVLDSSSNNHGMDALALKYLGCRTIPYEEVAGKGAKQICFDQVSIEQAAPYAAEDADITLQLHETLYPKIAAEAGLKFILNEIELPLIPVLARIERNGVLIDVEKLKIQTEEIEKRLLELESEAYDLADTKFNMNSPKQLQEILFTKLNLPVLQKTPTGQASTADAVLQELALDYPLPKIIIEYRSLSKLISTYTKTLPEQIDSNTGRIHTSYNQTGAATGRLSSSDPNLQNIPIRMAEGRRIRQAFIASPGCKIISADYSQIELRIMSHMSDDPALLSAFARNLDIHQATASEVLGIPLDEVTADQRRSAKAINFGLIYGMSAFGLAKQLGIDRHAAQDYIEKYFARYPKVREYMENTRKQAHELGYVETLWGRRLYLPEINSSQIMRQKAAERAAINAPLQGTAADIIKRAMINIDAWLSSHNIAAKMIMQVHDELVFEVAEDKTTEIMEMIRKHMMEASDLKVPLLVSIGVGDNWDAAH